MARNGYGSGIAWRLLLTLTAHSDPHDGHLALDESELGHGNTYQIPMVRILSAAHTGPHSEPL